MTSVENILENTVIYFGLQMSELKTHLNTYIRFKSLYLNPKTTKTHNRDLNRAKYAMVQMMALPMLKLILIYR